MSPFFFREERGAACFPRVSGDEPQGDFSEVQAGKFSPRERG